jgi:ATP-binding cassette subfamily B protein
MEYGKLVEAGTHEQLLEKNGVYTNLWRVQSGLK